MSTIFGRLVRGISQPAPHGAFMQAVAAASRVSAAVAMTQATALTTRADIDCTVEYPPRDLNDCPNRRPRPGYTPTVNGCGPAGFLNVVATLIPDGWLHVSFKSACDRHDACYGTCSASPTKKDDCDRQMYDSAVLACNTAFTVPFGPGRIAFDFGVCQVVAQTYYDAVSSGGAGPYDRAQKEACECCRPQNKVYCGCNKTCYSDVSTCLKECKAGLGCFTDICAPAKAGQC